MTRVNPLNESSDEPIDVLSSRPSKAKRNRSWEKKNKPRSYRGIQDETHERLVALSEKLKVPLGELMEYLLSDGLDRYRSGELPLDVRPVIGKNTLLKGR